MLNLDIPRLPEPIRYTDRIMLVGSCFTEHISDRLEHHKFNTLSNPHGILFNPLSVAHSLETYLDGKEYEADELFYLNELWNSWDHHTRFSDTNQGAALERINTSQAVASRYVRDADWILITLGTAFQYYLAGRDRYVANNHRAPAQWFEKLLMETASIYDAMAEMLDHLAAVNPYARVLLTISPVRHIRDGAIDNNRSKARLIEAVHALCTDRTNVFYFPAYELVIDVLRDYRFYDIDYVHPNYLATNIVWDYFVQSCVDPFCYEVMKQVNEIMTARNHKPRFPGTQAHARFREQNVARIQALKADHGYLDFGEELRYFSEPQ